MNETTKIMEANRTSLPRDCSFTPNDWHVLPASWYPIAIAADIADKPVGVKLLDVKLVCYRSQGNVVVARDLCFHRGAPLSMGWVENDEIVCPYHGFCYNCEGACTAVPAHPSNKISPKLKLIMYPAVQHYGLIWTSLAGSVEQIPAFSGWDDSDYVNILPPSLHKPQRIFRSIWLLKPIFRQTVLPLPIVSYLPSLGLEGIILHK